MAETFEKYEELKNRTKSTSWLTVEDKVDAAMDLGELLKGAYERLEAFVRAYELDTLPDMRLAETLREKGYDKRSQALLRDVQALKSILGAEGQAKLLLDDLKVLLDQMPEGYRS